MACHAIPGATAQRLKIEFRPQLDGPWLVWSRTVRITGGDVYFIAQVFSGQRLARFLDELSETALPKVLVCDNGSELTSKAMFFWSQRSGTKLHFIQPGKPMQDAFVESFNGTFRDNCLNEHWFKDLADARQTINAWRHHYNHVRPHSSLGYMPPEKYARQAA